LRKSMSYSLSVTVCNGVTRKTVETVRRELSRLLITRLKPGVNESDLSFERVAP